MTQTGGEPIPRAAPVPEEARPPQNPAPEASAGAAEPVDPMLLSNLQEGKDVPSAFEQFAEQGFIAGPPLQTEAAATTEPTPTTGLTPDEIKSMGIKAERYIEGVELETIDELPDPYMLHDARKAIDPVVGGRFDAHGIDTNSADGIRRLNDLLVKGVDPNRPFFTAELRATDQAEQVKAGSEVRDTGSFIVIGKPDQLIRDGGIGGVIIHEAYYDAIPVLQERFPGVKFIKASEMTEGLNSMITETADNEVIPASEPPPIAEAGEPAPENETAESVAAREPMVDTEGADSQLSRTDLAKAKFAVAKARGDSDESLAQLADNITLAYEYDLAEEILDSKQALALAKGGKISQLRRKALSLIDRGSNNTITELEEHIEELSTEHQNTLRGDKLTTLEGRFKQAKSAEKNAKSALSEAKVSGDQEAIKKAQREYDITRKHLRLSDPEKKKSLKRLIAELMLLIGLGVGKDVGSDVGNTVQNGSGSQRR